MGQILLQSREEGSSSQHPDGEGGRKREREREEKKKKILTLQQKLGTDPEVMRLVNWQMDSSRLEQQPPATHTPFSFSFPFPFSFPAAASRREAAGASAPLASSCSPRQGRKEGCLPPPSPSSPLPPPARNGGVLRESVLLFPTCLEAAEPEEPRGSAGLAGGEICHPAGIWGHRCCRDSSRASS